jgi:hypothetical protein
MPTYKRFNAYHCVGSGARCCLLPLVLQLAHKGIQVGVHLQPIQVEELGLAAHCMPCQTNNRCTACHAVLCTRAAYHAYHACHAYHAVLHSSRRSCCSRSRPKPAAQAVTTQ